MDSDGTIHETRRIRQILQQLQDLGWSKVENIDQYFQRLVLIYSDETTEKVGINTFYIIFGKLKT